MKTLRCVIPLLVLLPSLIAQTAGTGALTGTVKDGTGAVIPNVAVTATNNDTGQERAATTGADGSYRLALLPPGTYKVKFAGSGFKAVEVPDVKVNVTETPVLDRSLELGAQSQQVTVEANVETIQTASSSMGTTVGANTATSIPLTTRNYTNILGLSAGANASVNNASSLGRGGMEIAVNGARTDQNTFQMDGVSIVNYASNGVQTESATYPTIGIPNPDTLAEFKIQTSLYDAGYGRNPGANVNVITKSGSNAFHGTAFEFFRNTELNANDFFRNRTCGLTPSACAGGAKQVLNQNQFGGVFGGPIKKDKLFFFASYQQTWQKNGAASQGYSSGITLAPIPAGDRSNTAAFQAALGAAFCPANHPGDTRFQTNPGGGGAGQGTQVACDGQISACATAQQRRIFSPRLNQWHVAIRRHLQHPGLRQGISGDAECRLYPQREEHSRLPVLPVVRAADHQFPRRVLSSRHAGNGPVRISQHGHEGYFDRDEQPCQ
jgi:hypothetical protein